MKLIKVDATTSTNSLARILNKENAYKKFCISAEFQSDGRGQLKSSWQSSRSENLTFTTVFNQLDLDVQKQFLLNALVCLKIYKVLKHYKLPKLSLKWPNDILSDNSKVCGILIENTLKQHKIKTAFVGIGLNVNQAQFDGLPKASSMINITRKRNDRDEVLNKLLIELNTIPENLKTNSFQDIINTYKAHLYKFDVESQFILPNGESHSAVIKDIALDGQLLVEFKSGMQTYFNHKEISQQY